MFRFAVFQQQLVCLSAKGCKKDKGGKKFELAEAMATKQGHYVICHLLFRFFYFVKIN
jgi:hypothetical protein